MHLNKSERNQKRNLQIGVAERGFDWSPRNLVVTVFAAPKTEPSRTRPSIPILPFLPPSLESEWSETPNQILMKCRACSILGRGCREGMSFRRPTYDPEITVMSTKGSEQIDKISTQTAHNARGVQENHIGLTFE